MSHSAFKTDKSWFKQLFTSSPDPTWIIDGNRFVECNDAAVDALGYSSREELLNVHPSKLSPPQQPDGEDSFAKAERMMATARDQGLHRFEWVHTKSDGTDLVAEVTLSIIKLGDKHVLYCVWRDVTARKNIEGKLLRQNDVLKTIIENFPGAISLFDADLRLAAHNDQFKKLFDLPDFLFEKPELDFEDIIRYNVGRGEYGPGDPEQQVAAIVARARNFQPHKIERVRPNGVALEIRGMPLSRGGFVTTYIDITERRNADERIRAMAMTDALTGLPNRLNLNEKVDQSIERAAAKEYRFALLFLDLDRFKKVNDTLGHDAGDELLTRVAAQLVAAVRETDVVARLGGDEFVVVLHDIENNSIPAEIAEGIIYRLGVPFNLTKGEAQIGTSIGIALYPEHGRTREALLRAADEAMYSAKKVGRGTWSLAGLGRTGRP
ncbi:MAG: diguanylate cyclase [Rhodocyclales bacterium]|nr:diguanylate cyclase [Rhodocyclales bacterium]